MLKTRGLDESLSRINREINSLFEGVDKAVYDHRKNPFNFMGKAVRSRFTLLLGDALGLERNTAEKISAAAELVHTASLLHDDCIDQAAFRRGLLTLNERLGTNIAILVGDLVVSLAFEYAAKIAPEMPGYLIKTVRSMSEGALLEENSRHKNITAAEAERVIELKTGALFRWCAISACHMAKKPHLYAACGTIGVTTGLTFQMIDDVLDIESAASETGKDALKDLIDGRTTLPLILALDDARFRAPIRERLSAIKNQKIRDLAPALEATDIIKENGFTARARALAFEKAQGLKDAFESLPHREEALALKAFLCALASRTK
ncbi:MAG: polyprenyl synthetase family protein [Elusimicrobia bacterium]|nr:polyprenyl synthetase family protein [Elusimicrobiota bacterium]